MNHIEIMNCSKHKNNCYFEGWYIKHQTKDKKHTICFIPAYHREKGGEQRVSLQIITEKGAKRIEIPSSSFRVSKKPFYCRAGKNLFTSVGMSVDIRTREFSVRGKLRYWGITPPRKDIMGPFRFVPHMQCTHGILSLAHMLDGSLLINGKRVDFTGGMGYIETDRGTSFPTEYLWTQHGWQDRGNKCVMMAVARIPICGRSFMGCICDVLYRGKEFRLATYKGARILTYTDQKAVIRQGNLRLEAELLKGRAYDLKAPVQGGMSRTVRENPACKVRYRFWIGNKLLFSKVGKQASFEFGCG